MIADVKVSVGSFLLFAFLASSPIHPILLIPTPILLFLLPDHLRLNCLSASCLGYLFFLGLANSLNSAFSLYLAVLTFFHFSEYVATGLGNPQNLSWDSYLINHSYQYGLAMLASWLEYFTWVWLYPSLKTSWPWVTLVGLIVCLVGEVVRKMAMLQAGKNFNHLVQNTKQESHVLVTSGIYSICRHPSYAGWFLWSVGSQIVLVNPFCLVFYAVVTFAFFKERIYVEEYTLIAFFGDQYREYQKRVSSGLPGIRGYHGPVLWGEERE